VLVDNENDKNVININNNVINENYPNRITQPTNINSNVGTHIIEEVLISTVDDKESPNSPGNNNVTSQKKKRKMVYSNKSKKKKKK
jgi:hypothetical protein